MSHFKIGNPKLKNTFWKRNRFFLNNKILKNNNSETIFEKGFQNLKKCYQKIPKHVLKKDFNGKCFQNPDFKMYSKILNPNYILTCILTPI